MYSTFDTCNPTKEDLIANAPEGATHYQPPKDETYCGVFWKVSAEGVALEAWSFYPMGVAVKPFVYSDGNASLELSRCIEIPEQGVFEENPTTIRERILKIRKERESGINEEQELINKLASMGFKLIEEINEKLEEAKERHDLQDWRNWKAGDILVSCEDSHGWFTAGNKYEVLYIDVNDYNQVKIVEDDRGAANGWSAKFFKFHSRPAK